MKESSEENLGARIPMVVGFFFPIFCLSTSSLAPKVSHEARPAEPGFEQGGGDFFKCLKTATKKSHIKGLKEHGSFIFIHILDFLYPKKVLQLSILGKPASQDFLHEAKGDSENANNATMQMIRFALEEWAVELWKFIFSNCRRFGKPPSKNHRVFSLNGTGMTQKVCSANTRDTFWYTKIVTEIPLVS